MVEQNQIPNEPTLKDFGDLVSKSVMLNMNCHHIGTVQVFNAATQTATVTINYKKTFFKPDLLGVYRPVAVDYPIIAECPVIVLGGALGYLQFPVAPGDECLLLFNDRDLDTWFQGNVGAQNPTLRLHSFSDAIALVGLRSLPKVIQDYEADAVKLQYGNLAAFLKLQLDAEGAVLESSTGALLGVLASNLIKFENASTSLKDTIQALITAVNNLVTQTALITVTGVSGGMSTSGVPANAAAIAAIAAELTNVTVQLGTLLE